MGNQGYDVIQMPAGPATPTTPSTEIDKRCTYQCRQCGATAPARISPQQLRQHNCRNGGAGGMQGRFPSSGDIACQQHQLQQQLRSSPIFKQFQQAMQMSSPMMGGMGSGGASSLVGMIRPAMGGMGGMGSMGGMSDMVGMGGMNGMGGMGNSMGLMNSCSQTSFGTPMGMGSGTNLNLMNLQQTPMGGVGGPATATAAANSATGCLNLSGSGIGLNVMSGGMVRPTCLMQTGGTAAQPTIMIRPAPARFMCPAQMQQAQQPTQQRFLTPCKSTGAMMDPSSAQACFNCIRSPGMRQMSHLNM